MSLRPRIRRSRRTDFPAVMRLLAAAGVPLPPPDRTTLRRFRRLVADLGSDLYLAVLDDAAAGLVHVSYTRQLAHAPTARIESLLVDPARRRQGIGSVLLAFADRRARRRGCASLCWSLGTEDRASRRFAEHAGLLHTEVGVTRRLTPGGDDDASE